jgi:hypothetical protein
MQNAEISSVIHHYHLQFPCVVLVIVLSTAMNVLGFSHGPLSPVAVRSLLAFFASYCGVEGRLLYLFARSSEGRIRWVIQHSGLAREKRASPVTVCLLPRRTQWEYRNELGESHRWRSGVVV